VNKVDNIDKTTYCRRNHMATNIELTLTRTQLHSFMKECMKRMAGRLVNESERYTFELEVIGIHSVVLRVWEHSGLSGKTLIKRKTIHLWS